LRIEIGEFVITRSAAFGEDAQLGLLNGIDIDLLADQVCGHSNVTFIHYYYYSPKRLSRYVELPFSRYRNNGILSW
jgi:hypothetical protein